MSAAVLTRARERLDRPPPSKPEIDLGPLVGTWVVFEAGTTGITRIDLSQGAEGVSVRAFGSGEGGEAPDWGLAVARVFSDDVASDQAWAFRASYEPAYARVELFGYLNRGVLAVDAATSFVDGERSDYFTRELFYRT